jgi:hypothetical protein
MADTLIDLGFSQNWRWPRGHLRLNPHKRDAHIKFLFKLILFKPRKSLKSMLADVAPSDLAWMASNRAAFDFDQVLVV